MGHNGIICINCSNSGAVYGEEYVGGINGINAGTVLNCYNIGSAHGGICVGGICGGGDLGDYDLIQEYSFAIFNCYNTGSVECDIPSEVGGIVGDYSNGTIQNCYYMDDCCSISNGAGIALSSDEMRLNSSYEGFDFHNIWAIEPNTDYPYPQFIMNLDPSYGEPSAIWDGSIASGFASGTGAADDPYIIKTAEQLAYFANSVNNGTSYVDNYICLDSDIQLNDYAATNWILNATPWITIGIDYFTPFSVTFDGRNHTISGVYINGCEDYQGLFGNARGNISNVSIADSYIMGKNYVGGVLGEGSADVLNCSNKSVIVAAQRVGGIAGDDEYSDIINCRNEGAVFGNSLVGGITGNNKRDIENCENVGSIVGNKYIGGITGRAYYGYPFNCFNLGSVYGAYNVGGIVGKHHGGSIWNCYNIGLVLGNDTIGGIVGSTSASITNCYNAGTVSGVSCVGGIAGMSCDTVNKSYNIGSISGTESVGGVVGECSNAVIVTNCYYLDTSCPEGNLYGTPLTDTQLRTASSYAGFDFDEVWTMEGNLDYPYAELIGMPHGMSVQQPIASDGDVDGDGNTTVADAILVVRFALGLMEFSDDQIVHADVNGDGVINTIDALMILRISLGLMQP